MDYLPKFKKNGLEGFKECVENFEITSVSYLKDKMESCILEDPVYTQWVIKNLMHIEHFLNLTSDDVAKVCAAINNYPEVLARAFFKTPLEKRLATDLPKHICGPVTEEMERMKELRKSVQETSLNIIIKTMRKLQNEEKVQTTNPWRLPPVELLRPPKITPGKFRLAYEDGTPALEGEHQKNQREGVWKHFYPNGALMAEGVYKGGQKSGLWGFWYPNKAQKAQGEYVQNVKQGPWKEWDKDGQMTQLTYAQGKKAA